MNMNLQNIKKVYFVGIGGIGMSAIARMLLEEGKEVFGSDRARSLVTEELEKLGVKVFYEQKADNITPDIDLVIYTIAMPADSPELVKARELRVVCKTYPEMLGLISADKYTIAISGTHGKTTTTAMVAEVMAGAKLDPTVIVGSLLKSGTNFIAGKSNYLVVEACEYCRSFLNINPKIIVITNIDNDHLDYYKNLSDIQKAFVEFVSKLPSDGFLVCDANDPLLFPVIEKAKQTGAQIIDYSKMVEIKDLLVPGAHNIKNAQSALAVAQALEINQVEAIKSLEKFAGTWRRFEYKGKAKSGALVYDDYAHHPTEIKATIQAARDFMTKKNLSGKLIIVFQPHLYSRTKLLKDDFAMALALADEVVLMPIYAAREPVDPGISSLVLVDLISGRGGKAEMAPDLLGASKMLLSQAQMGDLVITMGAGDISQLAANLL